MDLWPDLLKLIESEAGPELRDRIEERAREELQGKFVRIPCPPVKPKLSRSVIFAALAECGSSVDKAARMLGVSRATIWEVMDRNRPEPREYRVPR